MASHLTSTRQTLLKLPSRLWLCAQLVAVVVALVTMFMTLKGTWKLMQRPGFSLDWNSAWDVAWFIAPPVIGMFLTSEYLTNGSV
jgi:hypothetical protein